MFKTAIAALALLCSPALATECSYRSGEKALYFVTPMLVAVADQEYRPPYACYTSSLGTGVDGRLLSCSDGFEGPLNWTGEKSFTFRDATWNVDCEDADDQLGIR